MCIMNSIMTRLNLFYKQTVKPITVISVILCVDSYGYHNSRLDFVYNRKPTVMGLGVNIAYSAMIGGCIGVIYPIAVPVIIMLESYDRCLEKKEKK